MFSSDSLDGWLSHIEQLHPKSWDFGLERVQAVALRMGFARGPLGGIQLPLPVVTVGGTNGKGSTCAMLESVYQQAGYKTAAHTKPHLVHFEERLRLNGQMVAASALLEPFAQVERARLANNEPISLSYFEFSMLAIVQTVMDAHARGDVDVLILEVGLGGRLDAVNIFDADCAILTSIDLDHMEYLGNTREAIGLEKAQIMRAGKHAVLSDPVPPESVLQHANSIGADLWITGRDFNVSGDKQQWGWAGRGRRYSGLGYPALRGANQLLNAAGVLAAVEAMRPVLPVPAQAVRNGFAFVELPGRFQMLPGSPAVVLDVAHNPHAVAALAENLDAMGYFPGTHAVYGTMADKDVASVLKRISPLVDTWHLCDLPIARAAKATDLAELVRGVNPKASVFTHAGPSEAFAAAMASADPTDRIVVFGSFYAVGGVMQRGLPKLAAKHLA